MKTILLMDAAFFLYSIATIGVFVVCIMLYRDEHTGLSITFGTINILQFIFLYLVHKAGAAGIENEKYKH